MVDLSQRLIAILLWGLLILTAIFSIGTLYWWNYPLELLSNFRVYYILIAWGIAIACLLLQVWAWQFKRLLLLALALATFNSVWLVDWYLPHPRQDFGDSIRVLTFNINIQNDCRLLGLRLGFAIGLYWQLCTSRREHRRHRHEIDSNCGESCD